MLLFLSPALYVDQMGLSTTVLPAQFKITFCCLNTTGELYSLMAILFVSKSSMNLPISSLNYMLFNLHIKASLCNYCDF